MRVPLLLLYSALFGFFFVGSTIDKDAFSRIKAIKPLHHHCEYLLRQMKQKMLLYL